VRVIEGMSSPVMQGSGSGSPPMGVVVRPQSYCAGGLLALSRMYFRLGNVRAGEAVPLYERKMGRATPALSLSVFEPAAEAGPRSYSSHV
jgi:hypothetical protein